MPCNTCSMDGVTITCDNDQRCAGTVGKFCKLNNSNSFGVNVTVKITITPGNESFTQTFLVVAGGETDLGCDNDGFQSKTCDITAVQPLKSPKD
jgi:hypothetical protein